MTLSDEQKALIRALRADVQQAVYLGVDPAWLIPVLTRSAETARDDYVADTGYVPSARW